MIWVILFINIIIMFDLFKLWLMWLVGRTYTCETTGIEFIDVPGWWFHFDCEVGSSHDDTIFGVYTYDTDEFR